MEERYRALIAEEFRDCVERTIERVMQRERTYRPFHSALLSEDVIFWSAFERSFSTSFGQRVIEEVARLAALSGGAEQAQRQRVTMVELDEGYESAIHEHMQALRSGQRTPPWEEVLEELRNAQPHGRTVALRVISDLWWEKDGVDNFVSLKTVMPNIDQTAVAKEDCLRLSVGLPGCRAYFGLPYNPFGERRQDYAFGPPMGIFDFHNDPAVLIGRDLWDTLGGEGCYEELLEIAAQVGEETRDRIARLRR